MKRFKTALEALLRNLKVFVSGKPLLVNEFTKAQRLVTCRDCLYYSGSTSKICSICYCSLEIKTALKAESCPIGKW